MIGRRKRARSRADPHRIHQLEYELGLRDDAPAQLTDAPGAVMYYRRRPPEHLVRHAASLQTSSAILKEMYSAGGKREATS